MPFQTAPDRAADLLCFSHLRWDFVFQRPQHLLTRAAAHRRVFYFEEPVLEAAEGIVTREEPGGVVVATPHLQGRPPRGEAAERLSLLLDGFLGAHAIRRPIAWYYTPMALPFSRHVDAAVRVYDCMDELSAFAHAPPELRTWEGELLRAADLVFTGGESLYEAKRDLHPEVHAFPSSVDVAHFRRARRPHDEPWDQAPIVRPRLGFFGVIDERLDTDLLAGAAELRPDWQFVMLGPVCKIDVASLPRAPNIHWLGRKAYEELPAYLSGWDVALLPFARNESTRYISPTKTPEYLAGGRPVVSTSIRDVVRPYAERGLVRIADTPEDLVRAAEAAMADDPARNNARADEFLADLSWDRTVRAMFEHIERHLRNGKVASRV